MELGLSGVCIDGDPEIAKGRNPSGHEQTEHLEKAKRAARISVLAETRRLTVPWKRPGK